MASTLESYFIYLKLEKGLSENTMKAYRRDLQKWSRFLSDAHIALEEAGTEHIRDFLVDLADQSLKARSQARLVSALKSYYHFLIFRDLRDDDPTELLETPRIGFKLPNVLSLDEVENIMNAVDLSGNAQGVDGHRNRAILEVLYGSGIRVSELVELKISECFLDEGYMKVEGKGSKQRLVPLSSQAVIQIRLWNEGRKLLNIKSGEQNYLFLNRYGSRLTRAMIFVIVRDVSIRAGIKRKISPHVFRHSFATHLLQNGANLRAIQQLLGHESITTTELYTHVDMSYLRKVINEHHPLYKYRPAAQDTAKKNELFSN